MYRRRVKGGMLGRGRTEVTAGDRGRVLTRLSPPCQGPRCGADNDAPPPAAAPPHNTQIDRGAKNKPEFFNAPVTAVACAADRAIPLPMVDSSDMKYRVENRDTNCQAVFTLRSRSVIDPPNSKASPRPNPLPLRHREIHWESRRRKSVRCLARTDPAPPPRSGGATLGNPNSQ